MNRDHEILLHAGLDGELDVEHSLRLHERLAEDPAFKAAWDSQLALRAAIRERAATHTAPAELRARLMQALALPDAEPAGATRASAMPRSSAVLRRRTWMWAGASALAASVLTGGTVLLAWKRPWGLVDELSARGAEDAVTAHTRAQLAGHLIEVASADQHTVRPWLSSHLSFAPAVPDLSAQGFELVGGRRDQLGEHTVGALIYRRRLHVICAFVEPHADERAPEVRVVRGFNVISMAQGGMAYWIVSDLNARELGDFAELLREATK